MSDLNLPEDQPEPAEAAPPDEGPVIDDDEDGPGERSPGLGTTPMPPD